MTDLIVVTTSLLSANSGVPHVDAVFKDYAKYVEMAYERKAEEVLEFHQSNDWYALLYAWCNQ